MAYQSTTSQEERGDTGSTSGVVSSQLYQYPNLPSFDHQLLGTAASAAQDSTRYSASHYDREGRLQPQRLVAHSNPIAIVRSRGDNADNVDYDSSDGEQDDDEIDDYSSAQRSYGDAAHHHSLPSRLLRAPLLGSVPTNDEYLSRRNMLPPVLRLSEHEDDESTDQSAADTTLSYGSLRDSQMQGRLLEQASSFQRDRHIGGLRPRVPSTMASSAPVHIGLSIGERIQQQRKLQQALSGKTTGLINSIGPVGVKKESTSSLAAMMEASSLTSNHENASAAPHHSVASVAYPGRFHGDFNNTPPEIGLPDGNAGALSTSLTGLEILRRGLRGEHDPSAIPSLGASLTAIFPHGSSLLSRSFSHPRSDMYSMQSRIGDSGREYEDSAAPAPRGASFLPPHARARAPEQGVGDRSTISAIGLSTDDLSAGENIFVSRRLMQNSLPNADATVDEDETDRNPDTEGAFDLDME